MELECLYFTTANEIMALEFEHQWQTNTQRDPVSLNGDTVLPSLQIKPNSNQAFRYNSQLIGNTKKRSMETTSEECAHKNPIL